MPYMSLRNRLAGILTALVVTAATGIAPAEDPCRTKCDQWLATCKRACADAPVQAQCRANCTLADQQCLADCADGD